MHKNKIANMVKNKENWLHINEHEDNSHEIVEKIRSRNATRILELTIMLKRWKFISMGIFFVFLLSLFWIIRRPAGKTIVYVVPTDTKPVIYSDSNKKIIFRYNAKNNFYVGKTDGKVLKIKTIKQPGLLAQRGYSKPVLYEDNQNLKSGSNNDNELDGLYVPGLENSLLASAKLEF